MEAELFHVHGRTDITKLIVALRNFENAPKIVRLSGKQTQTIAVTTQRLVPEKLRDAT